MKQLKFKPSFLLIAFLFLTFNIILIFTLYLFDIRFQTWLIIFVIIISIILFILGLKQIWQNSKKKTALVLPIISGILEFLIFLMLGLPEIMFLNPFISNKHQIVNLKNEKLQAIATYYDHYIEINYYNYNPFFIGTKAQAHSIIPISQFNFLTAPDSSLFEYIFESKDKEDISDQDKSYTDLDSFENYLLPEDEEILYETKFGKNIIRFGKVDNVLGQNILVNVVHSPDNGINFYKVSEDVIKVSSEARFIFLNEQLGFAISTGKQTLKNGPTGMYVTTDSGKTFKDAVFNYQNEDLEYIIIRNFPYFEKNVLKLKCEYYDYAKKQYQELIFMSKDQGVTWNLI